MDRRDRKLLDKQMRRVGPSPRNDGAMILALVAVFLAGMTLGAAMFAHKSQPTPFTSNDAIAAPSVFGMQRGNFKQQRSGQQDLTILQARW